MNPKVKAGGQGAGAAGAVSTVLVWAAGQLGLEIPPEVASALTTVLSTAVGLAAGYAKPA